MWAVVRLSRVLRVGWPESETLYIEQSRARRAPAGGGARIRQHTSERSEPESVCAAAGAGARTRDRLTAGGGGGRCGAGEKKGQAERGSLATPRREGVQRAQRLEDPHLLRRKRRLDLHQLGGRLSEGRRCGGACRGRVLCGEGGGVRRPHHTVAPSRRSVARRVASARSLAEAACTTSRV